MAVDERMRHEMYSGLEEKLGPDVADALMAHLPPKVGVVAEIADILRYRLKAGMPAVVARKNAEAYGGRSMLDLIASDEHEWLLTSVKESFDFRRVA